MTTGKILFYSVLGVLGVITLGFGAKALLASDGLLAKAKAKKKFLEEQAKKDAEGSNYVPTPYVAPSGCNDSFRIKFGSCGENVKAMQNAFITKYGGRKKGVLELWGADGIWGMETENDLKAKGLPTSYGSLNDAKSLTSGSGVSNGYKVVEVAAVRAGSLVADKNKPDTGSVYSFIGGEIVGYVELPNDVTSASQISPYAYVKVKSKTGKVGYVQASYLKFTGKTL